MKIKSYSNHPPIPSHPLFLRLPSFLFVLFVLMLGAISLLSFAVATTANNANEFTLESSAVFPFPIVVV
ncbi:MAG: hypothetical protein HXX20_09630 [Chloroflexi bacterium]|nr:hypothetical protein [Chloroflexota bacterium]